MLYRNEKGFGLIELLVSILIGLIVVTGITSLVVATLRTNTENLQMTRLTQDLRSVMQLVTSDLRRAGFDQDAVFDFGTGAQSSNDFRDISLYDSTGTLLDVNSGIQGGADASVCVLYSYDQNADGDPQDTEAGGFRLNSDEGLIEAKIRNPAGDTNFSDDTCGQGRWEALTDPSFLTVTEFTITTVDEDGDGTNESVPAVIDESGNLVLTIRELEVTIAGELSADPTMIREINETIRVRNDFLN